MIFFTSITAKNLDITKPRYTLEPLVTRDWQNLFAMMRFRYIGLSFNIFYYYYKSIYKIVMLRRILLTRTLVRQ